MDRLHEKIALITGGAGGIGAATARRMLDEGAFVILADIDGDRARACAAGLGNRCSALQFDARDVASCEAMVAAGGALHGRIDILHNNACTTNGLRDGTATETDFDGWDNARETNLRGYFAVTRFVLPGMVLRRAGTIINTASVIGMTGSVRQIAYGVSKAGVIALSQYVATQYGRFGVRCNSVSPGFLGTDAVMTAVPELIPVVERHIPMGAIVTPEDVAATVAFLASDDARQITGRNIVCDRGFLCHVPHYADALDTR